MDKKNQNKKYPISKILKVIDKNESYYVNKFPLADLPLRCLIIGRSQMSGKSTFLTNLLLNPHKEFYSGDFEGQNIFIFSSTKDIDQKIQKIIKQFDVENVFDKYDDDIVEAIYKLVQDDFLKRTSENKKPKNYLLIFDDIASSGAFKVGKNKMIDEIFSRGRHICLSCIILGQYYTTISPSIRSQCTMAVFFPQRNSDLELIADDMNYGIDKNDFKRTFRQVTKNNHDVFIVNFTNEPEYRYLDSAFKPIDFNN